MCCFETWCHKKSQLAYELYVTQVCVSCLSQITPTSYGSFVSFPFCYFHTPPQAEERNLDEKDYVGMIKVIQVQFSVLSCDLKYMYALWLHRMQL